MAPTGPLPMAAVSNLYFLPARALRFRLKRAIQLRGHDVETHARMVGGVGTRWGPPEARAATSLQSEGMMRTHVRSHQGTDFSWSWNMCLRQRRRDANRRGS